MQIATVLVATDFSETGDRAVEAGARLARDRGARVILLHALRPPPLGRATPFFPMSMDRGDIEETVRGEALDRLREVREEAMGGLEGVALELREGPRPSVAISDAADHFGADLVVVGTHALTGLARFVARSTAERVARAARRPVLVMTPDAPIETIMGGHLVVGIDDAPASVAALRWAGDWAARVGGVLTLFRAEALGPGDLDASDRVQRARVGDAQRALRRLAADHVPEGVRVIVEAAIAGDPLSSLVGRTERGEGLLVIGRSRPRGTWRSTPADRLLRRSRWPVVVVPDPIPLGRDLDLAPRRAKRLEAFDA